MTTYTVAISMGPKMGSGIPYIHVAGCGHLAKSNVEASADYEAESAQALDAEIHAKYADEPSWGIAPCAK